MFEPRQLHITDGGHYVVQLAPDGAFEVRNAMTGALIARCDLFDGARAVADSREWTDECDAEEERRARRRW
jgi:hypothetical protein